LGANASGRPGAFKHRQRAHTGDSSAARVDKSTSRVSFVWMSTRESVPSLFDRLGGRTKMMELLHHFYADVRQHNEIGPIFRAQIHDWPSHLEKIADFWAGATGGPANYSGPMPQRHFPLGLTEHHFAAWLDLWRRQCRIRLAPPEAEEMIRIAEGIGARLQWLIAAQARASGNNA
jgi:hemoglobin